MKLTPVRRGVLAALLTAATTVAGLVATAGPAAAAVPIGGAAVGCNMVGETFRWYNDPSGNSQTVGVDADVRCASGSVRPMLSLQVQCASGAFPRKRFLGDYGRTTWGSASYITYNPQEACTASVYIGFYDDSRQRPVWSAEMRFRA